MVRTFSRCTPGNKLTTLNDDRAVISAGGWWNSENGHGDDGHEQKMLNVLPEHPGYIRTYTTAYIVQLHCFKEESGCSAPG